MLSWLSQRLKCEALDDDSSTSRGCLSYIHAALMFPIRLGTNCDLLHRELCNGLARFAARTHGCLGVGERVDHLEASCDPRENHVVGWKRIILLKNEELAA